MTNIELIRSAPYAVLWMSSTTGRPVITDMPVLFNDTVSATQWLHMNVKNPNSYVIVDTSTIVG